MSMLDEETVKQYREERFCGACRHWHRWSMEREKDHWRNNPFDHDEHTEESLHFGDCDKVPKGTVVNTAWRNLDGTEKPFSYTYGGYSFEDECYDEDMHCFEES